MPLPVDDSYTDLQKKVIDLTKGRDISRLKEQFVHTIDSKRTLSQIKSMHDLLVVLEDRDYLHKDNVLCLSMIGEFLEIPEISSLVRTYNKLNDLTNTEIRCLVCNVSLPSSISPSNYSDDQMVTPSLVEISTQAENKECQEDLEEPIKNISKYFAKSSTGLWKVLLRELGLEEGNIYKITKECPDDDQHQAEKALNMWKLKENATFDILKKALDSRLCKRKGLQSYIMYSNYIITR